MPTLNTKTAVGGASQVDNGRISPAAAEEKEDLDRIKAEEAVVRDRETDTASILLRFF